MNNGIEKKSAITTKELVICAMFIALTFVATMFVNVRLPIMGNGGLIHLGNVPLFLAAFVFDKRTAAIAGGFGMALFDLVSGWTAWAPFTLLIVGSMGWTAGKMAKELKFQRELVYTCAIAAACLIKVVGYYFTEVILYHNWIVPLGSIPGNVIQVGLAGVIVLPFAGRLSKVVRGMSLA